MNEFTPSDNLHIYGASHLWHGWSSDCHLAQEGQRLEEVKAHIEGGDLVLCWAQTRPERAFGTHNLFELLDGRPVVYVMALEPYVNWAWEYGIAPWAPGPRVGGP